MTQKTIIGVSVLAMTAVLCPPTWAGWTVTVLNPDNCVESGALGVSGGKAAGFARTFGVGSEPHASFWGDATSNRVDMHPASGVQSYALGISGDTQAGYTTMSSDDDAMCRAAVWNVSTGSYTDLTRNEYSWSQATGVSGNVQVGTAKLRGWSDPGHASLWRGSAESWVDLNPGDEYYSQASGVCGNSVVGWTQGPVNNGCPTACLWDLATNTWTALNPDGYVESMALGVSADEQVGCAFKGESDYHPKAGLWHGSADSWVELHPDGYVSSQAVAASGGKQVGWAADDQGRGLVCMWSGTAESCIDLNAFMPTGYVASSANAIEVIGDEIWIAGSASRYVQYHEAVLWHYTPDTVPEPSSLLALLCGVGTLGTALLKRKS